DKWLWAARFFKTRTMAARACDLSRVEANHQAVKPAREVHIGEFLQIRTEGGEFEVEVLGISDVRGPASIAQTLYRETAANKHPPAPSRRRTQGYDAFHPISSGPPVKT